MSGRPPKAGNLTEFLQCVSPDIRGEMEDEFAGLDFTILDDIARAHNIIARCLVAGKVSPEIAQELRNLIASATTLAAARAQGIFATDTPLDGAQALGTALEGAKARRQVESRPTEEGQSQDPFDIE